jgi:hypothetical protein
MRVNRSLGKQTTQGEMQHAAAMIKANRFFLATPRAR